MYLAGRSQLDIATELNISRSTVSRDLKWLTEQWLTESRVDFDEARARELARINRLELEYWDAWQKSCEDYKEQEIQSSEKPDSKVLVKVAKTQKQNGEPRFLDGVQWCIEQRCKLLGLHHKERLAVELTGENGGPIKSQHAEVHIYLPDNGRRDEQRDN